MTETTFSVVENAAHEGAFGDNDLPLPTEAQCMAGRTTGLGKGWNRAPDAIRNEAVRLYQELEMTIQQVAEALDCSTSGVARWLKERGVTRTLSQAYSISIQKGRKRLKGDSYPWQSPKAGKWVFADSKWELVRMSQLDSDPTVKFWDRAPFRVQYMSPDGVNRHYSPDLLVEYVDGSRVVEEIKPSDLVANPVNAAKIAAARDFFSGIGISFLVVTENEIGVSAIQAFKLLGLASMNDAARAQRRREGRNLAARKRTAKRNAEKIAICGGAKRLFSIETRKWAVDAYKSGLSLIEVAEKLSASNSSVRNWLREAGEARRRAARRPSLKVGAVASA